MNKLSATCAILPILAITYFLTKPQASSTKGDLTKSAGARPLRSVPEVVQTGANESYTPSQITRIASSKSSLQEAKEQRDAALSKVAANYTPGKIAKIVDADMAKRTPMYEHVFAKWEISESVRLKVLGVIRAREIQVRERRARFFQNASANYPNYKAELLFDNYMAETQLISLLGKVRYKELADAEMALLEKKIRAASGGNG
jgi:hypothetical protein